MIAELVLVLCLSASECIVGREQMPAEACVAKAARTLERYGRDPGDPPYLREPPACAVLTVSAR